jgi:hemerythrin-like domain-containing protein
VTQAMTRRGMAPLALGAAAACGLVLPAHAGDGGGGEDVSATEDLMREHGVLRRTLIVYAELVPRLRSKPEAVDAGALAEAAVLFRTFGEDYHERSLEEQYVFPEVVRSRGDMARLVETLLAQHQRGREITAHIEATARRGRINPGGAEPLARTLETMVRMYRAHAAWEDTVLFPAWKKSQPEARLKEVAERFEQLEHQQFGRDGFEDAVARITKIEQAFGLTDLGTYTAPPPPSEGDH